MHFPTLTWPTAARKPSFAILVACLILVIYIGFLMVSNYRNQIALRESTLKRFRLDLEKRAESLGYFFSERKYDLRSLAASREISAYFTNKSLGMSEQYGLKVSFFVIDQMLKKTIVNKVIQSDGIYGRFLLIDQTARILFDTAFRKDRNPPSYWQKFLTPEQSDPSVFIEDNDGKVRILLAAPCIYKNQFVGELIGWLNLDTLLEHFVDFSSNLSRKGLDLATVDGALICPTDAKDCPFSSDLIPNRIMRLPAEGFESFTFSDNTKNLQKVAVTRQPMHNLPLNLVAWVPYEEVFGSLAPWQLLVGTGSLAMVILLGIGVLMRFNTQNLILKVRFDESERQQALLSSKNRQLEDEIRKRRKAEKKLEEQRTLRIRSDRLRSLGEMAAGIAHELNQPLVGVRGLAELISIGMESEQKISRAEIRDNADIIVEQADRMVHIINHVRLFARDAKNPETSLVDLNDVVRSGLSLLTAQFRSHGLMLENKLARHTLPVQVNPFSVEEVILNLLSNARDAVEKRRQEEGSIYTPRVGVNTWHGKQEDKATVWLEVRDNGTGIAQIYADKVFDPFFTTKDPDKGTGLGLSICKSIVEGFGGNIQFTSTEAKGTVFTINFPAHSSREADTDEYRQGV